MTIRYKGITDIVLEMINEQSIDLLERSLYIRTKLSFPLSLQLAFSKHSVFAGNVTDFFAPHVPYGIADVTQLLSDP